MISISQDYHSNPHGIVETNLIGGFNPPEKYESDWIIIPNSFGENKKCSKPPTSIYS
jgi:hypothetical protein